MNGPAAVGKTYHGKILAGYYNIPIINVKEIANSVMNLKGEEGDKV